MIYLSICLSVCPSVRPSVRKGSCAPAPPGVSGTLYFFLFVSRSLFSSCRPLPPEPYVILLDSDAETRPMFRCTRVLGERGGGGGSRWLLWRHLAPSGVVALSIFPGLILARRACLFIYISSDESVLRGRDGLRQVRQHIWVGGGGVCRYIDTMYTPTLPGYVHTSVVEWSAWSWSSRE